MKERWAVSFDPAAVKVLKKLGPQIARRLLAAVRALARQDEPTNFCKPLTGPLRGLWRLRVSDYRVIVDIRAGELVIVVIALGHRSRIYE